MILRVRTIAAALISCAVLAACSSGSGRPSHDPTSPKPPKTSSRRPGPPQTDMGLEDLNTKSFDYAGGCGFEVPAVPVKLVNGRQTAKTPAFDGQSSRAEWTRTDKVAIDGKPYLVVYLTCSIGKEKLIAAHLIGRTAQRPTDLGILATGSKISIASDHDQLDVQVSYRTTKDKAGESTGSSSYKIAMAGLTPVRLFSGEQAGSIGAGVAKLAADGYEAGLVGVSGYSDDPSETTWVVGLLDKPNRVLTAESLGGGYDSGLCWKPTVYTQAGEKIGHRHLAFNDSGGGATGTAIDLATSSKAPVGVRGRVGFPIKQDTRGLLIPANGVVPALATATTQTASNGQHDSVVTTKAPADAYLDSERFGAASGSEFQLPIGAFATADGRIAMTGAWYNVPVNKADAASGMRPIVDPGVVGEKTCG